MILTIATAELRRLFLSPLAWTILAAVQLILALVFFGYLKEFLQIQSQLLSSSAGQGITAQAAMAGASHQAGPSLPASGIDEVRSGGYAQART